MRPQPLEKTLNCKNHDSTKNLTGRKPFGARLHLPARGNPASGQSYQRPVVVAGEFAIVFVERLRHHAQWLGSIASPDLREAECRACHLTARSGNCDGCGELSDNSGGDFTDDENPESCWRLPPLTPSISASGWLHAAIGFIRAGFNSGRVPDGMAGNNCRAMDIVMLLPCF